MSTQIRALASQDAEERIGALRRLYGSIYYQGDRFTATPHALAFLMELVLSDDISNRASLLDRKSVV